jgi:hypothetical protein
MSNLGQRHRICERSDRWFQRGFATTGRSTLNSCGSLCTEKGGLNGYANARDRNLFDEILESDDRRWAFVSLAGISHRKVLGHAMQLTAKVAKPISDALPVQTMVGVRAETVLAVLVLVFFSLVAGLVARTNAGKRIMSWSENSLLGGLPQYQLVKSMAEALAQI